MRKITGGQIAIFVILASIALLLALLTTALSVCRLPPSDYRGLIVVVAAIVLAYAYLVLIHRLYLACFPLQPGVIPHRTAQEFRYHVYLLFYLIFFYPVLRSGFVPGR